jgi:hypothetical protein
MMVSIECFKSKTCRGKQVQYPPVLAFLYIFDVIVPNAGRCCHFPAAESTTCLPPFLDVLIWEYELHLSASS